MKILTKLLKGRRHICFLDFEGTQYTSEMIAFGGIIATVDKNGVIKNYRKPIEFYVKAKNKIGRFVEELTGIKQAKLDKVGIPFSRALKEIKQYCGINFKKTVFMTFGNHDMKILNQSISYNLDTPKDITEVIHHNYVDYQSIISDYVRDETGNPYSLANYLNIFDLEFSGTQHDPKDDAINLMRLYDAFSKKQDIVLKEYLKALSSTRHLPSPIKKATEKLSKGEDVSSQDFISYCEDDLK